MTRTMTLTFSNSAGTTPASHASLQGGTAGRGIQLLTTVPRPANNIATITITCPRSAATGSTASTGQAIPALTSPFIYASSYTPYSAAMAGTGQGRSIGAPFRITVMPINPGGGAGGGAASGSSASGYGRISFRRTPGWIRINRNQGNNVNTSLNWLPTVWSVPRSRMHTFYGTSANNPAGPGHTTFPDHATNPLGRARARTGLRTGRRVSTMTFFASRTFRNR